MKKSSNINLETSSLLNLLLTLASLVLIAFGMQQAKAVITPILLALMLSILFLPIQRGLQRSGLPSWLALLIVMLIVLTVVSLLISITVLSVTSFINRVPEYSIRLQLLIDDLIVLSDNLPIDVDRLLAVEMFNVTQIMNITSNLLKGLLEAFSSWFFVILLVLFMLADFTKLPAKMQSIYMQDAQIQAFADLLKDIRRYVSIATQTGIITGVLNAVMLLLLGVDFAILWGLLGFLMNYIPNLGIVLSIIPPATLALLKFGWTQMLFVIIGFIVINTLIENILRPRMLGHDLNMSPLFVLVSLVFWGYILGPAGTILAVPLTLITIKLLLENSEETRWLAVLMSAHPEQIQETNSDQERSDRLESNN
ncbi:MAG: AI-2E family transporter [Anaerolineales bacterium]